MSGEFESLDTEEPLARHVARHNYDRLIMLSDGIFAIAATLLALGLEPPAQWTGTAVQLLAEGWRALFAYLFGFLVVASFWFSHRNIFARLRAVDTPATFMTLVLLCLIAMVPGVAGLVADFGPSRTISIYLVLAAGIAAVQVILWWYAAYFRPMTHPGLTSGGRAAILGQSLTFLASTTSTALIIIAGLPEYLIVAVIVPSALVARRMRRLRREHSGEA